MINKRMRQAVSTNNGLPWKSGLIIKPGTGMVKLLKDHNIEYYIHEDKEHKEFYADISQEEELLLTLSMDGVVWIPYGTFDYNNQSK